MYDPIHDRFTQASQQSPDQNASSSNLASSSPDSKPIHRDHHHQEAHLNVSYEFENPDEPVKASRTSDRHVKDNSPERKRKRDLSSQPSDTRAISNAGTPGPTAVGEPGSEINQNIEIDEQERKRLKRYEKPKDRQRGEKRYNKEVKSGPFARREVISREDERRDRSHSWDDDRDRRHSPRRDDHRDDRRDDRRDDQGYRSRNQHSQPQYRYRDAPPLPHLVRRDPSPEAHNAPRSPPRKLKKPGARMTDEQREATKRQQQQREVERERKAADVVFSRGVDEVVRAHYNSVPERGKQWRKTDSKISGLRSYNNWVKSTLIQKFAANEDHNLGNVSAAGRLKVLDIGCGKGGDLLKWKSAPQPVELYVGVDSADISIRQAKDRYIKMREGDARRNRGRPPDFHAEFFVLDAWTQSVNDNPLVDEVVNADGGFDVVSLMFCMHYAFESEQKIRGMLKNISGSLRRGGRFIGTIPSSDTIYANVKDNESREFGNSLYRVSFPKAEGARKLPDDGAWRPPWGWKYSFFLEESVEDVPEYVVPWEAFRAIASEFNLNLEYKRQFEDIWNDEEKDDILSDLSERMGVKERTRDRSGKRLVQDEEWEACKLYLGFAFRKV